MVLFGCFLPLAVAYATGGDDGIRTHDPLLAGQVLSQLSYTPMVFRFSILFGQGVLLDSSTDVGPDLFSRTVSSKVSSALHSLTSVFGMGTGGPCALTAPTSNAMLIAIFTRSLKIEQRNLSEFLKL